MEFFDSLHLLRIRGLVAWHLLPGADQLLEESMIVSTERGCVLSPKGYELHEHLISAWRESIDLKPLERIYQRFLDLNTPVKSGCSNWQSQANDADALFTIVGNLTDLIERADPVLRRAGKVVPRFETYADRLNLAMNAAAEGDQRYITDPTVDSVHNIWFECHEDFLTTLGKSREQEGSY